MNLRHQYYRPMVQRPRPMLSGYPLRHPCLPPRKAAVTPKAIGPMPMVYYHRSQSSQSLRQSLDRCPWSTNQASSSFSSPRICRPSSAKRRASARFSLVNLPCLVLASVSRARPSLVLGPVTRASMELTAAHRESSGALARRARCAFGPRTSDLASLGRRAMVWD